MWIPGVLGDKSAELQETSEMQGDRQIRIGADVVLCAQRLATLLQNFIARTVLLAPCYAPGKANLQHRCDTHLRAVRASLVHTTALPGCVVWP